MIDHQSIAETIQKQITIYFDKKLKLQIFILNQMLASSIQLTSKIRLKQYLSVY